MNDDLNPSLSDAAPDTPGEDAELANNPDPQPETLADEPQVAQKKERDAVQTRMNQLTAQRYQEQRRGNELAQQNAQMQAELNSLRERTALLDRVATLPDAQQYSNAEDYRQAVLAQQLRDHEQQSQQAQQARAQQAQQAERANYLQAVNMAAQDVVQKGEAVYPDFAQVVNNPSLPDLTKQHPAVVQALLGSDKSAEIAYFLGKNPKEAHRMTSMAVHEQIKQIGRIEAQLSARPTQSTPEPLGRVGGQSQAPRGLSDKLSTADWMAARNKELAKR